MEFSHAETQQDGHHCAQDLRAERARQAQNAERDYVIKQDYQHEV